MMIITMKKRIKVHLKKKNLYQKDCKNRKLKMTMKIYKVPIKIKGHKLLKENLSKMKKTIMICIVLEDKKNLRIKKEEQKQKKN